MPTPNRPLTVAAKSTQITAGTKVIFRNLTRGGKVTVEGKSGEAVGKLDNAQKGDTIAIEVYGKYNSSTTQTVSKGGVQKSFGTLSEDTSTVGVDL